ncbi:photosystem II 5 kDa protein, chloroplastic [Ricinus communis]|uniref:Photosystem II 5 kDa protein, chloroplast, putative n=1 Tax=Ricinus communis TaxID=3988 RepID=B9RIC5_RICCO|nr:photosystem II 5 kDa protein, chloroplastic [Ricinus communis]EEF48897.1 Photosystem II 5 kDa protein, chloroplast precursor, putative [Ricinus communis]|eukprot:XP_002513494.1 photosystem II 5 kDa protein, chloroplastic [Ricinus communis]
MASMTMTASFLAGSTLTRQPFTAPRRGLIVAKASKVTEGERVNVEMKNKEESSSGRRDLVFAAAAAAAFSVAKVAMADEPKAGTLDAKKKYASICVSMPTAKICHK